MEVRKRCSKSALHPTQKPVALIEELIKTYTNSGDLILDSCAGSCTTAVASINTGRNYICIEKDIDNFYGRIENQTASNIYFSLVGSEGNSLVIVPHNWIKFMAPIKSL